MFKLTDIAGKEIPLMLSTFPAGEALVRVSENNSAVVHVEWKFERMSEVFTLALIADAIKQQGKQLGTLYVPYLPFARQDRVCSKGESFSLKVVAEFINDLNFFAVVSEDVHSDVAKDLINSLIVMPQYIYVNKLCRTYKEEVGKECIVVIPDAGAAKKSANIAGTKVYATKTRNPLTGELSGFDVASEHIGDKDFLIVDDICDGGGTFIGLAKELQKLTTGKIYLYITHCIASKGFEVFDNVIEKIYTINPMCEVSTDKLVIINKEKT